MNKVFIALVAAATGLAVTLGGIGLTREGRRWDRYREQNTVDGFRSYLSEYPSGDYASEARRLHDDMLWESVVNEDSEGAYERYLESALSDAHRGEALDALHDLHWQRARTENSIEGYASYLDAYPDSRHEDVVAVALEDLRWESASASGSFHMVEDYLRGYPKGRHAAEAFRLSDDLRFKRAVDAGTVFALEKYIRRVNSLRRDEARVLLEPAAWKEALSADVLERYEGFLEAYPRSEHREAALNRIDDLRWKAAAEENTVRSLRNYLESERDGRHRESALEGVGKLVWRDAERSDTIYALEDYLRDYPGGQYAEVAVERIAFLKEDPAPYRKAMEEGTDVALTRFILQYPGHSRMGEARAALGEIRKTHYISTLLDKKQIEVRVHGVNIHFVNLRVRNLSGGSLTVEIPVGAQFVPLKDSYQTMVVTKEESLSLEAGESIERKVAVACSNLHKSVPYSDVALKVGDMSNERELLSVLNYIESHDVGAGIRQAAVWIVTDDANYQEMGSLQYLGSGRVISGTDAVGAMKICHEAGIDIKNKAIWKDLRFLKVSREDLVEWLEEMGQ